MFASPKPLMNTPLDIDKKKSLLPVVMNQPLVYIALFYGFGAALSPYVDMKLSTVLFIIGGFILLFFVTLLIKRPIKLLLFASMFFVGLLITTSAIPAWYTTEQSLPNFEHFEGVSTGEGYVGDGYVVATLQDVVAYDEDGKAPLDGNVRLVIFGYSGEYDAYFVDYGKGSQVSVESNLQLIPVKQYDGAFDLPFYRMMDGINYEASCHYAQVKYDNRDIKFDTKLQIFRNELKLSILADFDRSTAGIIIALLMGDKHYLPDSLYDDFQTLGIAHFLAVSGMHIGILVGAILWIFRKIKLGILPSILTSFIVVLLYALLAGGSPSVMRAVFMWIVFCMILLIGEKPNALTSMALVFLGLLILNPLDIFSISFKLSFVATGGIVLLSEYVQLISLKIKLKPIRWLVAGMLVTVAAILAIWTLLINSFGYISPASVFSTMMGVIPITVILLLSVLYAILFTIGLPIPQFLNVIMGKSGDVITNGMDFLARYVSLVYIKPVNVVIVVLSMILLLVLSRRLLRTRIWIHGLTAGIIAILIIILSFSFGDNTVIDSQAVVVSYYNDTSILLISDGDSLAGITNGSGKEIEVFCEDNQLEYPKTLIFMCDESKQIVDLLGSDIGVDADTIYVPIKLVDDMTEYITLFEFDGDIIGVRTAIAISPQLRFRFIEYSAISKGSKLRYCVEVLGETRLQYIDPRYYRAGKQEFKVSDVVVTSRFTKSRLENISYAQPANLIYSSGMSFGSEYDELLDKNVNDTYNTNRIGAIGIKDNILIPLGERVSDR